MESRAPSVYSMLPWVRNRGVLVRMAVDDAVEAVASLRASRAKALEGLTKRAGALAAQAAALKLEEAEAAEKKAFLEGLAKFSEVRSEMGEKWCDLHGRNADGTKRQVSVHSGLSSFWLMTDFLAARPDGGQCARAQAKGSRAASENASGRHSRERGRG